VSDLAGNLHPGGVIGTFTVGMQIAPALYWITLPTTATLGASVNLSFGAAGSFPAAAGDLFTVAVDWDGDGGIENFPALTSGAQIAHTFTSLGTHTVRVRVTDPHGLTSSERTAQIVVSNSASLPVLGEMLATPIGYYNGATGGAVAAESAGTIYFFGGYPLSNDNSPIVTWNFATPGAPFVFRGDFDNGPILFEGAGIDGRGRIVIYGGYEPGGGATASCRTYTLAGGPGGGVASKPSSAYGAAARDNLGRLYSITAGATYRYTAGASGSGLWATLPAPPFAAACASYDGAGTSLPSPVSPGLVLPTSTLQAVSGPRCRMRLHPSAARPSARMASCTRSAV
jgi:PKD repeat protein